MRNKYYTVMECFDVLRPVGSRPSNTYIGSSQVIETIYAPVTVMPGEELHDLVGGLFHVDGDGVPYKSRLTHPPHIFEAHHHRHAEGDRLQRLIREGFIEECVDAPMQVDSYAEGG